MEFFSANTKIRFMSVRHWSVWLLAGLMVASIISIAVRGFNLGLDFAGGAVVEVAFEEDVPTTQLREALAKAGLADALVQSYSNREFAVRVRVEQTEPAGEGATASKSGLDEKVSEVRAQIAGAIEQGKLKGRVVKSDFVGGQVGAELLEDGLLAVLLVGLGILIYISLRFEWKFAVAAVACTVHDVILVLGFFSVTQIEFDLNVLAAVLALIGYSLNDTIVVFDRVREMFRSARKLGTVETFDVALNSTLSRTILTSVTTMFAVLAMLFFGGPVLYGFALCLSIGIVLGAASTILFACPILLMLGTNKRDLLKPEQDPKLAEMP
jgi:preprotein translocase subunit SecF